MTVQWFGDKVKRRVMNASLVGVDDTTAAAAIQAKGNHPGWRNRTGTAEGSIRNEPARREGERIRGRFGSWGVAYFIWLELKYGSTLRHAADLEFPRLARRIQEAYRRGLAP